MSLILNIDTALDVAWISLANEGKVLASAGNPSQYDHAAWIHQAIKQLLKESGHKLQHLRAIGVCIGPGSYTGLRIGLSTAKGLCYTLNVPLITLNTLEVMALGAMSQVPGASSDWLYCPMIDARRMEVFAGVYDHNLNVVVKPHALELDSGSFHHLLEGHKMLFLGSGSEKFQNICQNPHAMFKNVALNPVALATLTYRDFVGNNFVGLTYVEPLYLKEFFTRTSERTK